MIKPKIKGHKVFLKIDVWRRVWAGFGPKKASELLPLDVAPRVLAELERRERIGSGAQEFEALY